MILEFIIIALGVILATVGSLTFWPVTEIYQFYIPIVLFIAGYVGGVLLLWVFYDITGRIIDNKEKEYEKPSKFARNLFAEGIAFINYHARVKVKFIGKEKMPIKERFLLVANHKSNFDSMILTANFANRDIAYLMKQENKKIPLGGRLMHKCCYIPLDRADKLQSLKQMKKAQSLIERDVASIGVFPEGTRTKDGVVLGSFHEGVFNIAIKAKCPIVVVTFKNTPLIHKNFPFHSTKVIANIIGKIPYENFQDKTAKQISDEVHEMMLEDLSK